MPSKTKPPENPNDKLKRPKGIPKEVWEKADAQQQQKLASFSESAKKSPGFFRSMREVFFSPRTLYVGIPTVIAGLWSAKALGHMFPNTAGTVSAATTKAAEWWSGPDNSVHKATDSVSSSANKWLDWSVSGLPKVETPKE